MTKERAVSFFKWATGTLIVGAFGSGLWELFLSDATIWAGKALLGVLGSLHSGFKDSLHQGISSGPVVNLLVFPVVIVLVGIVYVSFRVVVQSIVRHKRLASDSDCDSAEKRERSERYRLIEAKVMVALAVLVLTMYSFVAIEILYKTSASNYVERSIDILAPHVAPEVALELRAQYRAIDSASSFYSLRDKLNDIAAQLNVDIPDFDPV